MNVQCSFSTVLSSSHLLQNYTYSKHWQSRNFFLTHIRVYGIPQAVSLLPGFTVVLLMNIKNAHSISSVCSKSMMKPDKKCYSQSCIIIEQRDNEVLKFSTRTFYIYVTVIEIIDFRIFSMSICSIRPNEYFSFGNIHKRIFHWYRLTVSLFCSSGICIQNGEKSIVYAKEIFRWTHIRKNTWKL